MSDLDWDACLAQIKLRNDLTRALMEKNTSYTIERQHQKVIAETVSAYPPDLLRKISNYVDPASNPRNPGFGINTIRLMIVDGATPEQLNEAIHFLPMLDHTTTTVARRMITALHLYPQLPQSDDYSREGHAVITQCTALLHITYSMFHLYNLEHSELELPRLVNTDWTLTDQKLVDLVLTHPEQGEAIRDFIIERGCVDTDLIEIMLATGTPALNHGIL